jgi:hypothetical protein
MVPSSPNAETTSRPISLAIYSCVKDMSAERNMVSFGGAMVAAQETGLPVKMADLERWGMLVVVLKVDGCLWRLRDDAANQD